MDPGFPSAGSVRTVGIRDAQVELGSGARSTIGQLLNQHLVAGPALPGAVRELAARLYRDQNSLPWTSAALQWWAQVDVARREQFEATLRSVAHDPGFEVAYGAALLLLAVTELSPAFDDFLFSLAHQHPLVEVRRLTGAYLLGAPRTRQRALKEMAAHPDLGHLAKRESAVDRLLPGWGALLQRLRASEATAEGLRFVAEHFDAAMPLQDAYLDAFEAGDEPAKAGMVRFVLAALEHTEIHTQTFACDLLTYPPFFQAVRDQAGPRLKELVQRLASDEAGPVRHYANLLQAQLDGGAAAGAGVVPENRRSLLRAGWRLVHARHDQGRQALLYPVTDLPVRHATRSYLQHQFPTGLYRHQLEALQQFARGGDVCLATGTASGKSMVFFTAAIELLSRSPSARVAAFYPLKALAREQETLWRRAMQAARLQVAVGRIDGAVSQAERERILRQCRVVLFTPDVFHAWTLANLAQPRVRSFFAGLRLVCVDEIHVYSGVFGSNAAYVFRRLQHAARVASGGASLRFIAASATVARPEEHLQRLFARNFFVIGTEADTAPRYPLDFLFLQSPEGVNLNSAVPELLKELARDETTHFIAFVDSRRQTEQLAAIVARPDPDNDEVAATLDRPTAIAPLRVLPYRAGFEEEDRALVQDWLSRGELRGVISTSALELGLNLEGINAVVLVGVPHSTTSLRQRIGRVGRQAPGQVIIVDAGGVTDGVVFRDPDRLFDRPFAESSLYLENRRIQYIHALCFAAAGGEYDMLAGTGPEDAVDPSVVTAVEWPEGFLELCRRERTGDVPADLQGLKNDAGADPWHTFPLRDVGSQFQVETRPPEPLRLGQLSFAQLMREAYPGAIYYYMTRPYRVAWVSLHEKRVVVTRQVRRYTTEPAGIPPQIFPRLEGDGLHQGYAFGDLRAVECDTFISELLFGYSERRGGAQKVPVRYPNAYWRRDRFTRNYATTGVLLHHPSLHAAEVQLDLLAQLILEAFLLVVPFDRTEVAATTGRHRLPRLGFQVGDRFIALYDQTYGSLRLTGRLLAGTTHQTVLSEAVQVATNNPIEGIPPLLGPTLEALELLLQSATRGAQPWEAAAPAATGEEKATVIMPGSVGWIVTEENQEFAIDRVFVHPKFGLVYRGKRVGERQPPNLENMFAVEHIRPIPELSVLGEYDFDTGEVTPIEP